MDLLKLAAKIELDDSSYNKGISNAEKTAKNLQGKMSAMTVAAGNLAADLIRKGVSAVQSIVGGAVDAYADYEQLVGGVETLFKDSASKVQGYAKNSFKTTGLSANEYMETVTSFSASLLQGLSGDTEAAADLANMAITDMADNANKMGTDITSIQNAYQGFAKQNYTMLDNLKLGYGGTKEEMIRLVNESGILEEKIDSLDGITFDQLVLAIHAIQTEMGITGTTAKEAASTISGSKASLAAAWQDLLSAVGGPGDQQRLEEALGNFKTSFSTYMENFIPSLVSSISGSADIATAIGDAISSLPGDLLSKVADAGLTAGTGLIEGADKVINWLIDSLATAFENIAMDSSQVEAFGHAIGGFIANTLSNIVENIPTFIEGIATVAIALANGLVDGIVDALTGEDSQVSRITESLQEGITEIDKNSLEASGLISYMEDMIAKYGEGAAEMQAWKDAQEELEGVMPGAGEVFKNFGSDIGGAVSSLKELNDQMRQNAIVNAMNSALREEYELLGSQELELIKQQGRLDRATSIKEGGMQDILGAIAAAAQTEIDQLNGKGNLTFQEQDRLAAMTNLANGYDISGLTQLQDLDLRSLWNVLESMDIEQINGRGYEAYQQAMNEAQQEISAANEAIGNVTGQIDATKEEISRTNAAMEQFTSEMTGDANMAAAGGEAVYDALVGVANKISSVSIVSSVGEEGSYMPEATGVDYVPYNGFKASLHRGERIVTASENKKMSSGVDFSGLGDTITAAIRNGMENVSVNSYLGTKNVTDTVNRESVKSVKARRFRG